MSRRVSRPAAAALLAIILSLTAPSAFAAGRDRGFEPGFGPRIVRLVKNFIKNFVPACDVDWPVLPRP
jgi:hypothetical protein